MFRSVFPGIAIILCFSFVQLHGAEGEWVSLFDGTDLSQWDVVGDQGWTIENGELVVVQKRWYMQYGWLVSKKDYSDFKLRMQCKVNSDVIDTGILVRDPGHGQVGEPADNGYYININKGTDDRNPTGSIYEVSRSTLEKDIPDGWFEIEIHCIGDHVISFLDGKKLAETHHRRSFKGAVGLQIPQGWHAADIHWKDIEILELPEAPRDFQLMEEKMEQMPGSYVDLLAGKTFETAFDVYWDSGAEWTIRDGVLRGVHPQWISWIFTKESYSDFILSAEVIISKAGNAGFGIRFPWPAGAGQDGDHSVGPARLGYEIQIWDDFTGYHNPSAAIYNYGRSYPTDRYGNPYFVSEGWNHFKIYCLGDHMVTYLNGKKMGETHDTKSLSGRIGFQVHDPAEWIEYKNVKIKVIQ